MHRSMLHLGALALSIALALYAVPSHAQSSVTYVSSTGADTNDCATGTTACATFTRAIAQTTAGGTVKILSPGSFGSPTITKSISIVGDSPATGIIRSTLTVTVATNDVVSIRGVLIDPPLTTHNGIIFNGVGTLNVENCVIHTANSAIMFIPSGVAALNVSDCTIAQSRGSAIIISSFGNGSGKIMIDGVRIKNSGASGIEITGTATTGAFTVAISNSVISGNFSRGIAVSKPHEAVGRINVTLDRTTLAHNDFGAQVRGANAIMRIANSTVTGNRIGLNIDPCGGAIYTYPPNTVMGNTNDPTDGDPIFARPIC